jgi:glycosyltransferase involved in cell wall biosynthesis
MFLSEMCILDRNSGAAISMHHWLKMLAANGWDVSSVSMSLFDGADEYPFHEELPTAINPAQHVGKRIRLKRDGIEHNIFNLGTSVGRNMDMALTTKFQSAAAEDIRRISPDIVIGFGSPNLVPLRALARSLGARTVFYLANDSYAEERRACFEQVDAIVTPSASLAARYKDKLGLEAHALGSYIPDFAAVPKPSQKQIEDRRRSGFVTLVNPSIVKGGLFFLHIASVMERVAPEITFLTIESRSTRAQIEAMVNNASKLRNIWWIPRQSDMHRVYQRTSLLLMPSVWFEAAGRVVPEAQTHAVPVLAHRHGALEEQVGTGGAFINLEDRFVKNMAELPSRAEVMPWIKEIRRILGSQSLYGEMARRALVSADRYRPEMRAQEIRDYFQAQLAQKGASA